MSEEAFPISLKGSFPRMKRIVKENEKIHLDLSLPDVTRPEMISQTIESELVQNNLNTEVA